MFFILVILFRPTVRNCAPHFDAVLVDFEINFRSCLSGAEKESFFVQPWFLAPYRGYCLCVEFERLDNECKSPPLDPASTHHLPARDKVRCSPNYENSLGESCRWVSALSPCSSHTSPDSDWQLYLTRNHEKIYTCWKKHDDTHLIGIKFLHSQQNMRRWQATFWKTGRCAVLFL